MTTDTTTETTGAESATDKDAEIAKWKDLARKHEGRAKENADAAKELAALKESTKSVEDQLAELRKETTDARAEALRMRFAAKHGINDEDAALFLTGSDEQTLSKQAARLAAVNADKAADGKKRAAVVKGEGTTNSNPSGDDAVREFTRNLFAGAD